MEFLEGESLADRLTRGPLGQEELLKTADAVMLVVILAEPDSSVAFHDCLSFLLLPMKHISCITLRNTIHLSQVVYGFSFDVET